MQIQSKHNFPSGRLSNAKRNYYFIIIIIIVVVVVVVVNGTSSLVQLWNEMKWNEMNWQLIFFLPSFLPYFLIIHILMYIIDMIVTDRAWVNWSDETKTQLMHASTPPLDQSQAALNSRRQRVTITELQCSEMSTKQNPSSQIPITAIISCRVLSCLSKYY